MTAGVLDVPPADPRVYSVLAEAGFGPELFNPRQHRAGVLVERYARELALDLCIRLGVFEALRAPRTAAAVHTACGFVPSFDRALRWLLEHARHCGAVVRDSGAPDAYRLVRSPAPLALAALRSAGIAADPSYAPAYELLDVASDLYPRVAHGEVQAERGLFLRVGLWARYFSNANGYYMLSNRVAARAAAARLAAAPGPVLEVGAGLGSATEALFEELDAHGQMAAVRAYRATEPVAFFRRRAQRALEAAWPRVPLSHDTLDLNLPWTDQGVAPQSCALVWGVERVPSRPAAR